MVHLFVVLGVPTNVTVAIHRGSPFFKRPCHIESSILLWVRVNWFHISHLRSCIIIEMNTGAVVPAQHIAHISRSPACQRHAPTDTSVRPDFSIPIAIGCHSNSSSQSINKCIRCFNFQRIGNFQPTDIGCSIEFFTLSFLNRF